ncbi:MAG: lysine--tRNA ligase [Nitrososphaeraceae archaeon]
MKEKIIGRGTWLDKVADSLVTREKKLGRSLDLIRVESGLGASGIPHIGSMGDAVRAFGISLALQDLGFNSELITYSDDMDGLRKIPTGFPSWLEEYIAKPVSTIPDPFGKCHNSYANHMSSLLSDSLDRVGIKYIFKSASDIYRSGILNNEIDCILQNSELLGKKISTLVGQDKYIDTLPYFPICENCKRLYVTHAEKYLSVERKIIYTCSGSKIGTREIPGCGYSGESRIDKGAGKLAWKVEFASRWKALDIRFEAYGKDIMDSVRVNDWVCSSLLDFPHPLHVKYEMFLDKVGKKISKSTGNVLTPQMWLKYGSPESILLLLYKRISGTRHIGLDDIPMLMDEYDYYEDLYFNKIKEHNNSKLHKYKGIYEYINKLNPPPKSSKHVPYRILVQQASLFEGKERSHKIFQRLKKYGLVEEKTHDLINRITLASTWSDDLSMEDRLPISINAKEKDALVDLLTELKNLTGKDSQQIADNIQTRIFEISKKHKIEPRLFFKLLYQILINSDRGPKLGNYLEDLGLHRTCQIIEKYI